MNTRYFCDICSMQFFSVEDCAEHEIECKKKEDEQRRAYDQKSQAAIDASVEACKNNPAIGLLVKSGNIEAAKILIERTIEGLDWTFSFEPSCSLWWTALYNKCNAAVGIEESK